MTDSTAISPPIDQLLRLAEVTAGMHSLLMLDAAWTGAEKISLANGGDTSGVADIGDRVDASLAQLAESTAFLRDLLVSYPAWFDAQVDAALTANRVADVPKGTATELLKGDHGSYAAHGLALIDALDIDIPAERRNVNAKTQQIRGGGEVVTDLEERTVCTIATVMGMGALVGCVAFDALGLCLAGGGDLLLVMHYCHHAPPTH